MSVGSSVVTPNTSTLVVLSLYIIWQAWSRCLSVCTSCSYVCAPTILGWCLVCLLWKSNLSEAEGMVGGNGWGVLGSVKGKATPNKWGNMNEVFALLQQSRQLHKTFINNPAARCMCCHTLFIMSCPTTWAHAALPSAGGGYRHACVSCIGVFCAWHLCQCWYGSVCNDSVGSM